MKLHPLLEWPANIARKRARKTGQFRADGRPIAVVAAIHRLDAELTRHFAFKCELSAAFRRTKGGNVAQDWAGGDPGCCLRFDVDDIPYTLPCDTYSDLAQNIAAIEAHLGAVRAMERYGVATTAQTMGAFACLPAPPSWQSVLGVSITATDAEVRRAHQRLALQHHPDTGGDSARFAEISEAMAEARKERPNL